MNSVSLSDARNLAGQGRIGISHRVLRWCSVELGSIVPCPLFDFTF